MVLIYVLGQCCPHLLRSEAEANFNASVSKHLLQKLLPTDRDEIRVVFGLDSDVWPYKDRQFVVYVDGDLTPSKHACHTIAAYCNGAFYCRSETVQIKTACCIRNGSEEMIFETTDRL